MTRHPLSRIASLIERTLNDAVLGFLALVSLFLLLAPVVFPLSARGASTVTVAEYAIVALFALEYAAAASLAGDKRAFVLNPWRIIDLLIIVVPIVALLPAVPAALRSSPVLRLLRLGRFALLGTRSGLALAAPTATALPASAPVKEVRVLSLGAAGSRFEPIPWEEGLRRIETAEPAWLFISGVSEERLASIAAVFGVPESALRTLFQSSVPRFDRLERFTALFARYPLEQKPGKRLERTPVLLVGTSENVVVLSRDWTELERRVEKRLAVLDETTPRMVRALMALVGELVRAYADVVEHLESVLLGIEAEQASWKDEVFLGRTFELRADILRVRSSLKHLKSVLRDLSEGQLTVAGSTITEPDVFRRLAEDADDVYGSVEDIRESLQALVDLRLNVASFQMNRVMRLLALLTALALIPATAGGLLGMNLQDTPWPGTLAQVSFGVAFGMAVSLYVFAIKGWLR